MNGEELAHLERDLGIALPREYKEAVLSFPVPACRGNSDTELWDDVNAILELNRELRAGASGGVPPWPEHMFALGHGGDGSPTALDLRDPRAPVWWVEKCWLESPGSGPIGKSFSEWLQQYIEDLRSDLESDGIDPDGTPDERVEVEAANAKQGCTCLLIAIGIVLVVVVLFFVFANR